ncbi:hypothetical protein EJ08DRAFT_702070 [Tothia fuscella]|uniref:Uncharacterized protein n=1 Tax=Tothia fuscella TaxID=1048955 RepID=A0A9P4TTV5_9PEZI|nr:hypothetical protein EJ08DRAFT_702070 [Tothia fuscella]
MEEEPTLPLTTDQLVQGILYQAVSSVQLPIPQPSPATQTKSQLVQKKLENLKKHHEQVRANIFAQLPAPTPSDIPTKHVDELSSPRLQNLLDAKPENGQRLDVMPKRPNEPYSQPLVTSQRKPMSSQTKDVLVLMKALEVYNEFARQEMRALLEEENRLRESGGGNVVVERVGRALRREAMGGVISGPSRGRGMGTGGDANMGGVGVGGVSNSSTFPGTASNVNLSRDPRLRR